MLSQNTHRYI